VSLKTAALFASAVPSLIVIVALGMKLSLEMMLLSALSSVSLRIAETLSVGVIGKSTVLANGNLVPSLSLGVLLRGTLKETL